jgi:predicted Zn finger-like uncharacterized protein
MSSAVTQCPECATRFRVTDEQLSVSEGMVRCGRCNAVFNAEEHFYSDEPNPQLALPIEETTATSRVIEESIIAPDFGESSTLPPEIIANETEAVEHLFNFAEEPVTETLVEHAPKPRRWPWITGSVLLLLILFAQALYFFRIEIAARLPGTKPALTAYCSVLNCTIPLPKKPELLSIESSDLDADPARVNVITLSALLHNRATYSLAYPNLELTLTDMQDKIVARRTFTPAEYLRAGENEKLGLAANREMNLKLPLDTAELRPTGYKLFLFYP